MRDDVVARALEVLVDALVERRAPLAESPLSRYSTMPIAVFWMKSSAVASSGSMNPCESPTARQFLFQCFVKRPIRIFRCRAALGLQQPEGFTQLMLGLSAEQKLELYTYPLP